MKLNKIFLAVAMFVTTGSHVFGDIITTIGSATFMQNSGSGFGLIPVSINYAGNNSADSVVNFEMSFTTAGSTANAFRVIASSNGAAGTYYNAAPNLTGWDNLGSSLSSNGSTVTIGFASTDPAGISINSTPQQLLWLPVSTTLGAGTYTLTGTSLGVNDPTFSSDLSTTISDGSFTITAVPEPSSFALLGLAGVVGAGGIVMRRRMKVAAE